METENPAPDAGAISRSSRAGEWGLLILALLPAILAIWSTPAFTTQDGPAHLYNAHILVESQRPDSPLRRTFAVRVEPLPNWAGHLALIALSASLPPETVDRAMTTVALVGFAGAVFHLRRRSEGRGKKGLVPTALYASLLGMNVAWLLGFWSFLIGAMLFPVTLQAWWSWRDRRGFWRGMGLAALIVLGYFGHVVSLGLTTLGLLVLAIATPGPGQKGRVLWTLCGLSPLTILLPVYRGLMRGGGPLGPRWGHFLAFGSFDSWRDQFGWADPISLGRKLSIPGIGEESPAFALVSPVVLLSVALLILVPASLKRLDRERRGWAILSAILILGGLAAPDTLGESHGNYLPQRIVLLGLTTLVPWLDLNLKRGPRWIASGLLMLAVAVQGAVIWRYAAECEARVGPFLRARAGLGKNQRIGTLLVNVRGKFRANPTLHADNLLGIGTGNIVWWNYETEHYYFPVRFRDDVDRPPSRLFEEIALMDDPANESRRADLWRDLLRKHHSEIDFLVVRGEFMGLEAIDDVWFEPEPVYQEQSLRIFRHR